MKFAQLSIYIILLILFTGCHSGDNNEGSVTTLPTAEVKALKVEAQKGHMQTEVVGTVRSVRQAVIAAKVTGTISTIPVVLGSKVNTGDLLVKITAEEISARVVQAHAQMEQAQRNLERERKLLAKNAATEESVKSLEEMYRVAEAVHRETETMLSYTNITAPFGGVITAKTANEGDMATPGLPLLNLEDNSKLQVVASVPEALILQIKTGDSLAVHIPVPNMDTQGTVTEVAPSADPHTRTALVKLNIPSDPGLRSGQFARVIIPGIRKKSLFIPTTAIHTFGQMEQIFILENNTAHLRLVRTGAVIGEQTEVLAGLEEGETVAITDGARLIDGQPVTITQ